VICPVAIITEILVGFISGSGSGCSGRSAAGIVSAAAAAPAMFVLLLSQLDYF
jgi:uncharacterized membrane protein